MEKYVRVLKLWQVDFANNREYFSAQYKDGITVLHAACAVGDIALAKFVLSSCLLDAGINALDDNGNTPLYLACLHGRRKAARLLLSHGANPDIKNEDGSSPLIIACKNKNYNMATLLLENGADPNIQDKGDPYIGPWTPLKYAVSCALIETLLTHGADPNKPKGAPAFHLACRKDDVSIVKIMLQHGADPNSFNEYDNISAASVAKDPEVIKLLVEAGADIESVLDNLYWTKKPQRDIVELLLEHGASHNAMFEKLSYPRWNADHDEICRSLDLVDFAGAEQNYLYNAVTKNDLLQVAFLVERGIRPAFPRVERTCLGEPIDPRIHELLRPRAKRAE